MIISVHFNHTSLKPFIQSITINITAYGSVGLNFPTTTKGVKLANADIRILSSMGCG